MEILFVLTHSVMMICLLTIIYVSLQGATNSNQIEKRPVIPSLLAKIKAVHINTTHITSTATALLTLFLR